MLTEVTLLQVMLADGCCIKLRSINQGERSQRDATEMVLIKARFKLQIVCLTVAPVC